MKLNCFSQFVRTGYIRNWIQYVFNIGDPDWTMLINRLSSGERVNRTNINFECVHPCLKLTSYKMRGKPSVTDRTNGTTIRTTSLAPGICTDLSYRQSPSLCKYCFRPFSSYSAYKHAWWPGWFTALPVLLSSGFKLQPTMKPLQPHNPSKLAVNFVSYSLNKASPR